MHVIYLTAIVLGFAYFVFRRRRLSGPRACRSRQPRDTKVHCLMVTRNLPKRRAYIDASLRNFHDQTLARKHLVIVNQSDTPVSSAPSDAVTEIMLPSDHTLSLGQVRNLSLEFVPIGALWTTWDDDDWRHETYLEKLVDALLEGRLDVVTIGDRLEYNAMTRFAHVATLTTGFMTFLATNHPRLRYGNADTLEDVPLKKYATSRLRFQTLRLSPTMYLRFSHGDNTSPYVNRRKRGLQDTHRNVSYFERSLTRGERAYLSDTLRAQYADI